MVYNNPIAYRVDLKPEHMLELADCEHGSLPSRRAVATSAA
jgi:dihydrodipicolinate synthase/N-acetylneuraminate lyase